MHRFVCSDIDIECLIKNYIFDVPMMLDFISIFATNEKNISTIDTII